MVRNVTLTIDRKSVTVPENTTILEAARSVNINIPTLCYLKDINEIGACRICCVEVEGMERLVPACDNVVADGMVVFTNSAKAREARRMNLRLILSHHDTSCTNCTRSGNCTLQQLANDFNMRGTHFPKKLRHEAVDYSTPLIRENDKCVQCLRCIQVCENVQSVKIWDLLGTGSRTVVDASYNRRIQDTECTYCGQCITHCPTAALRERDDTGLVFDAIDDPNTVTVAQVAPAVRAAWAEQFGLDSEFATPKRMVAALRELGFNYVFDTDFAAKLEADPDYAKRILAIGRGGKKPRKDLAVWKDAKPYMGFFYDEYLEAPVWDETFSKAVIRDVLERFLNVYDFADDSAAWFAKVKEITEAIGFTTDMKAYKADPAAFPGTVADVSTFLRQAVTGKTDSPDLYTIMQILGYDRTVARIRDCISQL